MHKSDWSVNARKWNIKVCSQNGATKVKQNKTHTHKAHWRYKRKKRESKEVGADRADAIVRNGIEPRRASLHSASVALPPPSATFSFGALSHRRGKVAYTAETACLAHEASCHDHREHKMLKRESRNDAFLAVKSMRQTRRSCTSCRDVTKSAPT